MSSFWNRPVINQTIDYIWLELLAHITDPRITDLLGCILEEKPGL